jgi:hypothetical protein
MPITDAWPRSSQCDRKPGSSKAKESQANGGRNGGALTKAGALPASRETGRSANANGVSGASAITGNALQHTPAQRQSGSACWPVSSNGSWQQSSTDAEVA